MNLTTDFYSKPSQLSIYSVYNKSVKFKQQKGGSKQDALTIQRNFWKVERDLSKVVNFKNNL